MNADPTEDAIQSIIAIGTFMLVWIVSIVGAGWLGFFLGWMPAFALGAIAYGLWRVVFMFFFVALAFILWQFR